MNRCPNHTYLLIMKLSFKLSFKLAFKINTIDKVSVKYDNNNSNNNDKKNNNHPYQ